MDASLDASMVCATSIECDDGLYCTGAETCAPFIAAADARGCVAAVSPPCAGGTCREDTDTCCFDVDGDGASTCDDDCDDDDAARFPGNPEKCDYPLNVDEDCNPATFGMLDGDGDGVASERCCNGAACGLDCDDTRAGTHLGVPEVCNGRDDDCNGLVDDDGVQVSGYADLDRDLYGDMAAPIMACAGSGGISSNMTDCNDAPAGGGRASPAFEEVAADGVDNDCDGMTDEGDASLALWYVDADADGFGTGAAVPSATPLAGHSLLAGDCNDTNGARSPIATELCNGVDDDCNGLADFPIGTNDWEDDDGDGVIDAACGGTAADCDDRDRSTYPGGPELCDGRDNDCDSMIDEMCGVAPPPDAGVADAGVDAGVDGGAPDAGMMVGPCTGMAPGTECRFATGVCDVAEACVAGSGACPADGYAGAGTPCRAATGPCDAVEMCTGSAAACPTNGLVPGGTACRASVGECDVAETCDGAAASCPADGFAPISTVCSGGTCDGAGICACVPSTELCNGADDDCDGTADDGFTCAATATGACTSSCGTSGTRTCSASCTWGACTPPVEICNGIDDDCDTMTDEGC